MIKDQVYAQAALLAGQLAGQQQALLEVLCAGTVSALEARLREGVTPEDCQGDFVTAASLLALAALRDAEETGGLEEFRAGDLTVKRSGGNSATTGLRQQGELVITPYLKDGFAFLGV